MKITLKFSLLANLSLIGLVLWLAQRPRAGVDNPSASVTVEDSAPVIQPAPPAAPPDHRRKFQWSQLESTDYPTYIANLRAIGCPRQTIRDLIVADVDNVYAGRREQLTRQLAAGPAAAGLQSLEREEAGLLLALLGTPAGSIPPTAANPPASPTNAPVRRSRFPDQTVSLPLVFQDPGPELKLDATQLGVFNELRETFNQELGGLNLDPADPEYLRRWQEARREADEMMTAMLGDKFTLGYQMQAADQPPAKR